MLSDAHERRLGEAAEQLGDAVAAAIPCNVTVEEQVQALFDGAVAATGGLDVVVNNAGLGGTANLVDMTDEQWATVLDVTLNGTFRCVRAALRHMQPRGAGVIVNNASVLGWRAQAGQAHYAAAKAGVMALTRCAAIEAADVRGARQRRRADRSRCTRSSPRSRATSCSTSSRPARRSAVPPSRGRSRTSSSSSRPTTPPT